MRFRFDHGQQHKPGPPDPPDWRRYARRAWGAVVTALVCADVAMTAAGDNGRWHQLIRHCLAGQGEAADQPGPVTPAPVPTAGETQETH